MISCAAAGCGDNQKPGVSGFIKFLFCDVQSYQSPGIGSGPGFFYGVPLVVTVQVGINVGVFNIAVKNMKGEINGFFAASVIVIAVTSAAAAAPAACCQGNG